jgi:hypothetical protein
VTAANVTLSGADSSRQGARRRAVFTIVQNEPLMLPLWLGYYGRYFEADDRYVLDHDSTDGSTDLLEGAHHVPIHRRGSFDHRWLRETVEAFQAFLLSSYDAVLLTELDEFVVADPRRGQSAYGFLKGAVERFLDGACGTGNTQGISLRLECPGFRSMGSGNLYISTSIENLVAGFECVLRAPRRFEVRRLQHRGRRGRALDR